MRTKYYVAFLRRRSALKLEFRSQKIPQEDTPKPITAVFIDYESLYLSFMCKYATAPDLGPMIENVKQHGRVLKIKVFGDFTKPEIDQERNRIRTVTSDIIDCGTEAGKLKKDFTDFIMLDHMYQEIIQNPSVQQYVLFTGDGHFSSVATFLKTFMDKIVGVYGIPGTLSHQLRECCSWSKLINMVDEEDEVYQMNLLRNFKSIEQKGLVATFRKTVEHAARVYGGNENKYELILREMITDGYVTRQAVTMNGNEFMSISPVWEKINAELMPALAIVG
jgi:competence protein ComGC